MQEELKNSRIREAETIGQETYWRLAQKLEPSLTMQRAVSESSGFCSGFRKAKAGAFAYDAASCKRKLRLLLRVSEGKGWSLRLRCSVP